jgi:glutamine amidotransferase
MSEVAIIDYGGGNMFSIEHALRAIGCTPNVLRSREEWESHPPLHVVLPGVGAFGEGMSQLQTRGLDTCLQEHAALGRPLLGICLGAQLLFESSSEFGQHSGLGIIPGHVKGLDHVNERVPHVGWKPVSSTDNFDGLFSNMATPAWMYFVHSFHFVPTSDFVEVATARHGSFSFAAAVHFEGVYGVQFHPEKSGNEGLQLLRNFMRAREP